MMDTPEENIAGSSLTRLPAPDCDILQSVAQIAAWKGITVAQGRQQIKNGIIPTYRLPGKSTVYAFKSEIVAMAHRVLVRRTVRNKPLLATKKPAQAIADAVVIGDAPIGGGSLPARG